jgi:hypothetical protein
MAGNYTSTGAKEETSTAAACSLQLAIYWEMCQPSQEHSVELALLPSHRLSLPNISPCSKEEAEGDKDMERASRMNNEVSNVGWCPHIYMKEKGNARINRHNHRNDKWVEITIMNPSLKRRKIELTRVEGEPFLPFR